MIIYILVSVLGMCGAVSPRPIRLYVLVVTDADKRYFSESVLYCINFYAKTLRNDDFIIFVYLY